MQIVLGLLLSLSSVCAAPSGDEGQIWAVLVAGSNEYYNYRHQADICHAYQIFHRHGVPDSNIIVMMYDDIANNPENPNKGVINNKPKGPNVYVNVPKDYTKKQVTPKNFLSVLTGDSKGVEGTRSGKVLKSGPNDHVFVYFADHGAKHLVGFPEGGLLYSHELIKALKTMYEKKMYKKLVFYMEACESGSMFNKNLPNNIDIFATTASNPTESSYACYWDDGLQAFLGDEYSVSWMEDVDSEEHQKNITTETLKVQFDNVVKRVTSSHPNMYGETPIESDLVKDFIGVSKDGQALSSRQKVKPFKDSVSARDVLLHTLNRKLQLAKPTEEKKELKKKRDNLIKGRKAIDDLFIAIVSFVTDSDEDDISDIVEERHDLSEDKMSCYKSLVETFNKKCIYINNNTYAMAHLYKFANLCATENTSIDRVLEAMEAKCDATHNSMEGVH